MSVSMAYGQKTKTVVIKNDTIEFVYKIKALRNNKVKIKYTKKNLLNDTLITYHWKKEYEYFVYDTIFDGYYQKRDTNTFWNHFKPPTIILKQKQKITGKLILVNSIINQNDNSEPDIRIRIRRIKLLSFEKYVPFEKLLFFDFYHSPYDELVHKSLYVNSINKKRHNVSTIKITVK